MTFSMLSFVKEKDSINIQYNVLKTRRGSVFAGKSLTV